MRVRFQQENSLSKILTWLYFLQDYLCSCFVIFSGTHQLYMIANFCMEDRRQQTVVQQHLFFHFASKLFFFRIHRLIGPIHSIFLVKHHFLSVSMS